ncbi:hypothetical protein IAR55_000699 [Kwoniella newhampshirensis]|uniref:Beta-glucosidase n=1 Tax=Kwoniella newhampshirensis TaxID=1651941 RepID=A0AAW0Z7L9_9TREE
MTNQRYHHRRTEFRYQTWCRSRSIFDLTVSLIILHPAKDLAKWQRTGPASTRARALVISPTPLGELNSKEATIADLDSKYIPPPVGTLPPDFYHGYSTAAFQCEGGWDADGKGPSVWDDLGHNPRPAPYDMRNGELGDDAMNSYYQYKEDIALLKSYGSNAYRFSISWPRVIPLGGRDDPINEKGLQFYSDLVDECLANGITPFPTLYHWDLPLPLEQRYEGWSNTAEIIPDFVRFADVMFAKLGDRVKFWLTINEPWNVVNLNGHLKPTFKPERDTFLVGHNLLLAHAHTVDLYRKKYQPTQHGKISIVNVKPIDDTPEVKELQKKRLDFAFHWFSDPLYFGTYPPSMLATVPQEQLPEFTPEDVKLLKGSCDFFALNSYSSMYVTGKECDNPAGGNVDTSMFDKEGKPVGDIRGCFSWLWNAPWGFRKLLRHVHERYTGPTGHAIYITENGFPTDGEHHRRFPDLLHDTERQNFFDAYLHELSEAVEKDGINIRGYMAWSLLNTMEWYCGYGPRLGVTHVDRENGFKRYPKDCTKVVKAWMESAIRKG